MHGCRVCSDEEVDETQFEDDDWASAVAST
jgi:hypothetical protein